jgi:hypothetical protein
LILHVGSSKLLECLLLCNSHSVDLSFLFITCIKCFLF